MNVEFTKNKRGAWQCEFKISQPFALKLEWGAESVTRNCRVWIASSTDEQPVLVTQPFFLPTKWESNPINVFTTKRVIVECQCLPAVAEVLTAGVTTEVTTIIQEMSNAIAEQQELNDKQQEQIEKNKADNDKQQEQIDANKNINDAQQEALNNVVSAEDIAKDWA